MSKSQLALLALSVYGAVASAVFAAEVRRAPWLPSGPEFRPARTRG